MYIYNTINEDFENIIEITGRYKFFVVSYDTIIHTVRYDLIEKY